MGARALLVIKRSAGLTLEGIVARAIGQPLPPHAKWSRELIGGAESAYLSRTIACHFSALRHIPSSFLSKPRLSSAENRHRTDSRIPEGGLATWPWDLAGCCAVTAYEMNAASSDNASLRRICMSFLSCHSWVPVQIYTGARSTDYNRDGLLVYTGTGASRLNFSDQRLPHLAFRHARIDASSRCQPM